MRGSAYFLKRGVTCLYPEGGGVQGGGGGIWILVCGVLLMSEFVWVLEEGIFFLSTWRMDENLDEWKASECFGERDS